MFALSNVGDSFFIDLERAEVYFSLKLNIIKGLTGFKNISPLQLQNRRGKKLSYEVKKNEF